MELCGQSVNVFQETYIFVRSISACSFNRNKGNRVIANFSKLEGFSLQRLHTIYCMNLYGCELWNMDYHREAYYHQYYSTYTRMIHPETRSFIYADDLCIAAQNSTFESIESTLSDALEHLDQYYKENHLRANPDKTQTCSFHLRNRETKRKLDIKWCNKELLHTSHPVYLGVTLDRTLSYKQHIMKVKGKTAARNNILKKLSNTKWGTSPSTIKTTALALSYSTAEYACPVWERSTHAEKIDPVLNEACRLITGCLKPTKVESLYQLAGIAPPHNKKEHHLPKRKRKADNRQ